MGVISRWEVAGPSDYVTIGSMAVITTDQIARRLGRLHLSQPGTDYFPRNLRPMLAGTSRKPFDDPGWTYEGKWDGFRLLALVRDGKADLLSRNLHPFTALFRPIADSLR